MKPRKSRVLYSFQDRSLPIWSRPCFRYCYLRATLFVMIGFLTAFGLGLFYFVGAIPAGVAAHATLWLAALGAWLGYSVGGLVVLVGGVPFRAWITKKLKINPTPDPTKLFWKIWTRFGLWGLAFVAPVSVGPQATAAIALALGESPRRIQLAISVGILPWVFIFSLIAGLGSHGLHELKVPN